MIQTNDSIVQEIGEIRQYDPQGELEYNHVSMADRQRLNRWVTSLQDLEGTIYLHNGTVSIDGGRTVEKRAVMPFNEVLAVPEGAHLCESGLFLGLESIVTYEERGRYSVRGWRGETPADTRAEEIVFHIENGPHGRRHVDEWYGLYIHRSILRRADGALICTVEGNLAQDTLTPTDRWSRIEGTYMGRTIVVISRDEGHTWEFLSTIAAPEEGDPIGEGFGEPAWVTLDDGRELCLMRSGHYTPMYACWSDDGGASWTEPQYTGLERGCDPCMLKLTDGRLAVAYGKRYPEGWSHVRGDGGRWSYPGEGLMLLAINEDGTGESWQVAQIGERIGSCYPTIIEVEPNVLFCQVDGWYWRVQLAPRP